jgi:hypothetical protein
LSLGKLRALLAVLSVLSFFLSLESCKTTAASG